MAQSSSTEERSNFQGKNSHLGEERDWDIVKATQVTVLKKINMNI